MLTGRGVLALAMSPVAFWMLRRGRQRGVRYHPDRECVGSIDGTRAALGAQDLYRLKSAWIQSCLRFPVDFLQCRMRRRGNDGRLHKSI